LIEHISDVSCSSNYRKNLRMLAVAEQATTLKELGRAISLSQKNKREEHFLTFFSLEKQVVLFSFVNTLLTRNSAVNSNFDYQYLNK
jgi:hypothetical protein